MMPPAKDRTARAPVIVEGVEFLSYRVGVLLYGLYAADGRACVARNHRRTTYSATLDGRSLGPLFRTEAAACRAVALKLKTADVSQEPSHD